MNWTTDVTRIVSMQNCSTDAVLSDPKNRLVRCLFSFKALVTDWLFVLHSFEMSTPESELRIIVGNGKPRTDFKTDSGSVENANGFQEDAQQDAQVGRSKVFLSIIRRKSRLYWIMLVLCCIATPVSAIGGVLLSRFYFTQGGSRRWLSAWIQTAGWPLSASVLAILCWKRGIWRPVTLNHALVYTAFGVLNALDCLLYAWGLSYLPASTSTLLGSSQLVFNCIFALLIVRQRVSAFGWNAVVLITASAVILALDADSDKPPGVTKAQYVVGFVTSIAAFALYGLLLPLIEIITKKMLDGTDFAVLEVQTYTNITSTIMLTIGMAINRDFSAMHHESLIFKSGPLSYYTTLFWTAVLWQVQYLASTGVILLTSSLLAGTILTASTPLGSIFAVVFFHDNFGGLKVMAMLLSLWGFVSYSYGGYVDSKAKAQAPGNAPECSNPQREA